MCSSSAGGDACRLTRRLDRLRQRGVSSVPRSSGSRSRPPGGQVARPYRLSAARSSASSAATGPSCGVPARSGSGVPSNQPRTHRLPRRAERGRRHGGRIAAATTIERIALRSPASSVMVLRGDPPGSASKAGAARAAVESTAAIGGGAVMSSPPRIGLCVQRADRWSGPTSGDAPRAERSRAVRPASSSVIVRLAIRSSDTEGVGVVWADRRTVCRRHQVRTSAVRFARL